MSECKFWDSESNYCALDRPSAQPNLQPTCNQLATDCISRQAAIDELRKYIAVNKNPNHDARIWEEGMNCAVTIIGALPSAQSEADCQKCVFCGFEGFKQFQTAQPDAVKVVRCKDCKYGIEWDGRLSCEWHGFYETEADWFCADGEEKEE